MLALAAMAAPDNEIMRVMIPSAIGSLGVSFKERSVTGIEIAPHGGRHQLYTSFMEVDSEFVEDAVGAVSEYLAGARREIGLDFELDDREVDSFARRVYREVGKVRYGDTKTYQQIARRAGRDDAYRLVLSILTSNPIPLLIPCHRVVTNKGGAGSYVGGTERKEWLIEMERKAAPSLTTRNQSSE